MKHPYVFDGLLDTEAVELGTSSAGDSTFSYSDLMKRMSEFMSPPMLYLVVNSGDADGIKDRFKERIQSMSHGVPIVVNDAVPLGRAISVSDRGPSMFESAMPALRATVDYQNYSMRSFDLCASRRNVASSILMADTGSFWLVTQTQLGKQRRLRRQAKLLLRLVSLYSDGKLTDKAAKKMRCMVRRPALQATVMSMLDRMRQSSK